MAGSAIIVGQSVASALGGILAEEVGTSTAIAVPIGAAIVVVLAALLNVLVRFRQRKRDVVHT